MNERIDRISGRAYQYVCEVLGSEFQGSKSGGMMKRLEQTFAAKFGVQYAISFINGTATLHAALAAAGVGPGDEVIVPPLTMASTAFAVLHAGAVPVFADIDPEMWTLSPESVTERLTERTKAIIPVAIYGLSPDMDPIMDLAAERNLFVLEDDAQCFLGTYKGRLVGTLGHAASFSFQSSKHMTSGEGGMVITNDPALANRTRRFGSLGYAAVGAGEGKISKADIQDPGYARHVEVGWNYRMPELCAAVALEQTERLEELVFWRQRQAGLYREALSGCDWLIPQKVPAGYGHTYWTFVVKLNRDDITWHDFRRKFLEFGGEPFYGAWRLNHLEPAFRGRKFAAYQKQDYEPGLCPVAETIQPRLIQFTTNAYDLAVMEAQAEALAKTVRHFR